MAASPLPSSVSSPSSSASPFPIASCWDVSIDSEEWVTTAADACNPDAMIRFLEEHAKTGADCQAFENSKYAKSVPSSGKRSLNSEFASCFERLMDAEFNKRQTELQKSNLAEFEREKNAQAQYVDASKKYCERFYHDPCPQTGSFNTVRDCLIHAFEWRRSQLVSIREGGVELDFNAGSGRVGKAIGRFKAFAQSFCKQPGSAFKDKKLPKQCPTQVLIKLQSVLPDADHVSEDCS